MDGRQARTNPDERVWRPGRRRLTLWFFAVATVLMLGLATYSLSLGDATVLVFALVTLPMAAFVTLRYRRVRVSANHEGLVLRGMVSTHQVAWEQVGGQEPKDGAMDLEQVLVSTDGRRLDLPHGTPAGLIDGWREQFRPATGERTHET